MKNNDKSNDKSSNPPILKSPFSKKNVTYHVILQNKNSQEVLQDIQSLNKHFSEIQDIISQLKNNNINFMKELTGIEDQHIKSVENIQINKEETNILSAENHRSKNNYIDLLFDNYLFVNSTSSFMEKIQKALSKSVYEFEHALLNYENELKIMHNQWNEHIEEFKKIDASENNKFKNLHFQDTKKNLWQKIYSLINALFTKLKIRSKNLNDYQEDLSKILDKKNKNHSKETEDYKQKINNAIKSYIDHGLIISQKIKKEAKIISLTIDTDFPTKRSDRAR